MEPIGVATVTDDNDCVATVILDPRAKDMEKPWRVDGADRSR